MLSYRDVEFFQVEPYVFELIELSKQKEKIKKKYGISKPFLLYVGGFDPRKNVLKLIESFNALNLSDLELVLVGAKNIDQNKYKHSEYLPKLQKIARIKQKNIIKFVKHKNSPMARTIGLK